MMYFFELINVFDSKIRFKVVHYPFTIGRSKDADLSCKSNNVSKKHAKIIFENNDLYIIDMSLNGTYINNEKIQSNVNVKLQINEEIGFGVSQELLKETNALPPHYIFRIKLQREEPSTIIDLCESSLIDDLHENDNSHEARKLDQVELQGRNPEVQGRALELPGTKDSAVQGKELEGEERAPELSETYHAVQGKRTGREKALEVPGTNSEVQGNEPEVQGRDPEVQGRDPEVQGRDPEVQGSDSEVQGRDPEVQGRDPEVQGRGLEVQERYSYVQCEPAAVQPINVETELVKPIKTSNHIKTNFEQIEENDIIIISDDDMDDNDMLCSQLFIKSKGNFETGEFGHFNQDDIVKIKQENLEAELYEFNWSIDQEEEIMQFPDAPDINNKVPCEPEDIKDKNLQNGSKELDYKIVEENMHKLHQDDNCYDNISMHVDGNDCDTLIKELPIVSFTSSEVNHELNVNQQLSPERHTKTTLTENDSNIDLQLSGNSKKLKVLASKINAKHKLVLPPVITPLPQYSNSKRGNKGNEKKDAAKSSKSKTKSTKSIDSKHKNDNCSEKKHKVDVKSAKPKDATQKAKSLQKNTQLINNNKLDIVKTKRSSTKRQSSTHLDVTHPKKTKLSIDTTTTTNAVPVAICKKPVAHIAPSCSFTKSTKIQKSAFSTITSAVSVSAQTSVRRRQMAPPDTKTSILVEHKDFVKKIFNWRIEFFVQPEKMSIVNMWPYISGKILIKMANTYQIYPYYKEAMQQVVMNELVTEVHNDYHMTVYNNSRRSNMYAFSGKIEQVKHFPTHTEIMCYTYFGAKEQAGKIFISESNLLSFSARCGTNKVTKTQFGIVFKTTTATISETDRIDTSLIESNQKYPTHKHFFFIIAKTNTIVPEKTIIGCRYFTSLHKTFNSLYAINKVEAILQDYILSPQAFVFQLPTQKPNLQKITQMPDLNKKQAVVVADAINLCKASTKTKLLMIEGPPGTGKSFVIINIILQLLLQNSTEKPAVLLLAQSNAAIDYLICKMLEIREKLPAQQQKLLKMIRIGQSSSTSVEAYVCHVDKLVESNLRIGLFHTSPHLQHDYHLLAQKIQNLTAKSNRTAAEEELLKKKLDESRNFVKNHYLLNYKNEERKQRDVILSNANIICSTIGSCCTFPNYRFNVNFKCCIIDEASQASEPDTLLPLMLGIEKFILVGDTKQLSAHHNLVPKDYLFGRSLFERLYLALHSPEDNPIRSLNIQYRMVPAISYYPNVQFYGGHLKDFYKTTKRSDLKTLAPYAIFEHVPDWQRSQVYVNQNEIDIVLTIITLINRNIKVHFPLTIGVITPYNDQRNAVNKRLKELSINSKIKISCSTIDSFQGQEEDIIILTFVRNTPNKFVNDPQRLNVALTRARSCLYIIASIALFNSSPLMKDLHQDATIRKVRHCATEPNFNLRRILMCSN